MLATTRSLLLLCLLASSAANGLVSSIRFNRLTVDQGLVQATVNAIHQDQSGFMWFGTADGLSRYDGYRFRNYRHRRGDPESLSGNFIRAIAEDADGFLWIGTHRGLSRYDPAQDFFRAYLPETAVRTLLVDHSGALWVGTDQGLYRYDRGADGFVELELNSAFQLVRALAEDRQGRLWIGTSDGGLMFQSPGATGSGQKIQQYQPLPAVGVSVLYIDAKDHLWVGTEDDGLIQLDLASNRIWTYAHDPADSTSLNDNRVNAVAEDADGRLWVATFSGLNQMDSDGSGFALYVHEATDPHSLGNGEVHALARDYTGLMWVGTGPGGVARFNPQASFRNWGPQTLGDNLGLCIAAPDDGLLWIGTANGLVRIGPQRKLVTRFHPEDGNPHSISHNFVRTCVAGTSPGEIWVGTRDGLNRYDAQSGEFQRFFHDPNDGGSLSHSSIRELLLSVSGDLWIGTRSGLNRWQPNEGRFERIITLATAYVSALADGSDGSLWVGTHSGLYRLNSDQTVEHFVHDPNDPGSLDHNIITNVFRSRDGSVWVGTNGGLNRAQDPDAKELRFDYFGAEFGLVSAAISDLREDADGVLWISTFQGISRLDPRSGEVRNFDPDDGTLPDYAVTSAAVGPDGTLYFGGLGGVTFFKPGQIVDDPVAPKVVFTDIRLANISLKPRHHQVDSPLDKAIHLTDELSLDYTTTDLVIEFAALHYAAPQRNQYEYRLDGLHEDWIKTDATRRVISLANLSPGDYELRVRASNKDGVWQQAGASLKLLIPRPWWMTLWARALAAVLFVTAIFALFKLRFYRLTLQRAVLKRQVSERTRELQSKNEELQSAYLVVERNSMTDSLTGLNNRRFLLNRIDDDMALSLRRFEDWNKDRSKPAPTESDLVFFLVDLDHFKHINDDHGHAAGDSVLIQFTKILAGVFRESDFCVRWGGEEFLAVARFCDRSGAPVLAERLRHSTENHPFEIDGGKRVPLTCSIGYAGFPFLTASPACLNWSRVVNVADLCLYAAKKTSRNAWVGLDANENVEVSESFGRVREQTFKMLKQNRLTVCTSIKGPLTWE